MYQPAKLKTCCVGLSDLSGLMVDDHLEQLVILHRVDGQPQLAIFELELSRDRCALRIAGAESDGFRRICSDDFENMRRQFAVYDALYAHCQAKLARPSSKTRQEKPQ